jgi:3-oxoacyl-[acyl-carrier protein] reductase
VAREIERVGGVAEAAQVDALDQAAVVRHVDGVAERIRSVDVSFDAIAVDHV